MKIKTSELDRLALDYCMAIVEGKKLTQRIDALKAFKAYGRCLLQKGGIYSPTTNWAQLGPIMDQMKVSIRAPSNTGRTYAAFIDLGRSYNNILARQTGPTAAIAVCRTIVASKLGDEVEIPDELLDT